MCVCVWVVYAKTVGVQSAQRPAEKERERERKNDNRVYNTWHRETTTAEKTHARGLSRYLFIFHLAKLECFTSNARRDICTRVGVAIYYCVVVVAINPHGACARRGHAFVQQFSRLRRRRSVYLCVALDLRDWRAAERDGRKRITINVRTKDLCGSR